jgi:hypothetical protein
MADLSGLNFDERLDVLVFAPYVSKLSDEDLLQAEKQILELEQHPGWVLVQEIIGQAVDASAKKLRYASVKDHATQSRDIGMQAGMESSRSIARAILLTAEERQRKIAEKVRRREASAR